MYREYSSIPANRDEDGKSSRGLTFFQTSFLMGRLCDGRLTFESYGSVLTFEITREIMYGEYVPNPANRYGDGRPSRAQTLL